MLVVGLTGGIASGKSTVSTELAISGIPIIDADLIARQVVEPGRKSYSEVVDAFSKDVPDLVGPDMALNRGALGRAVFGKPEKLKVLNRIVHGAVKKEIAWRLLKAYVSGNKVAVLDVPLLFESGIHRICGLTITVSAHRDLQLARLLRRNSDLTETDAQNRINSQMTNSERNFRADKIVENNGSLEELRDSVRTLIAEIQPGFLWWLFDLFPPFAVCAALYTVAVRFARDYYRGAKSE